MIKIVPISGESFGTRSFCFKVKTPDISILLDPGCSLGPNKDSKIPHPFEFKRLIEQTQQIIDASFDADIILISHYHHDHFKPNINDKGLVFSNKEIFNKIYSKKNIIAKSYDNNINHNQKKRAIKLFSDVKKIEGNIDQADNSYTPDRNDWRILDISDIGDAKDFLQRIISIENTNIIIPRIFQHGDWGERTIYIQPYIINYGLESFYYFPDVQGMPSNDDFSKLIKIKDWIKNNLKESNEVNKTKEIDIIAFGGMYRFNEKALINTQKIISNFEICYMDHHILRNLEICKYWNDILKLSEKNRSKNVLIPMNPDINPLLLNENINEKNIEIMECFRKYLFQKYPINEKDYKNLGIQL